MKKAKRTVILAVILAFVLCFGGTMSAFAATTASETVEIDIDSKQAVNSESFYYSGGAIVKLTFKAEGNSGCHYYLVLKSPSLYGEKAILTTPGVLGNGTDVYKKTLYNLSEGNYVAEVRPINGSTNGKTVTCTLTLN